MMMDEPIDVDDLFGDPTSLELSLASTVPAVRGLPQRLDELRLSGCCRYVSAFARTIVSSAVLTSLQKGGMVTNRRNRLYL